MSSRLVVVIALVACGGSKPPAPTPSAPVQTAQAATPAPAPAPERAPAAAPEPSAAAAPAPPPADAAPAKPLYERLRDTDGKVAGLAGFSIKRKASKNHCGGFAIMTTRGKKVAKDDEPLVAVYKLEFPTGLNFDPDPKHKKQKEASLEKFNKFLEEIHKVGGDANTYYEHQLAGDGDPAHKVAAAARIAQMQTRIASVLARAEIPTDVRKGEFADDKVKAFCDKLVEVAEPLQARAELAISACADKAKNVGASWWNEVCVP